MTGRQQYGCLLVFALPVLLLGACTSKRVVQVPQEWQTPPPQAMASGPASQFKVPAQPPGEGSASAVLKPPPEIRERDLSAGAEAAAPTTGEKKPAAQPQRVASLHLVDQAKTASAQGKTDQAISLLEQAIQVDVYNGEAFFQLARAWRTKKSRGKALEFSRKAEILFQDQPSKLKEVFLLEADLYKEAGDLKNSQLYRQKAESIR